MTARRTRTADEGWMQKPDWHCIGALEAQNVEIDGLTCIVRSRTWSIQMKDSTGFRFDDLRLIGGNPANANQDGMDWLGGGDTIVRNSFLRASDDVFAMQGNWDGYTDEDMVRPGHDVHEHSDRAQRAVDQHLKYRARGLAAEDLQLAATLRCATRTFCTAASGRAGRRFGLLGFWGANGAKGRPLGFQF